MWRPAALLLLLLATIECRELRRVRGRARQSAVNCPEQEGVQVYADKSNCHKFVKCVNGTLSHEVCGNGLRFDPKTALRGAAHNYCQYNWNTECFDREQLTADQELARARNPQSCPYDFGLFGLDDCSNSYVKCDEGNAKEIRCATGLVYDERVHNCNWPDLIEKCDSSKLLGGFECPRSVEEIDNEINRRFFPFPRFPVQNHPELYITCVAEGRPRLQSCGEKAIFDHDNLICVSTQIDEYDVSLF